MQSENSRFKHLMKIIGPGQLFASAAIGTSHLVLSTRAGAHYGMIFFWIICAALLLKYPFFEFSARYTNATGHSLLDGYYLQGKWAILLVLAIFTVNMFAVTGAIGAVCAGILGTMFGMKSVPVPLLLAGVFIITAGILLGGRYTLLDSFIKIVSIVLMITVCTSFIAVLLKGSLSPTAALPPHSDLLKGAGLTLLVSLIGFMPSGIDASIMQSMWAVEKVRTTGYRPSLKETLLDFNIGYLFTSVLALMFLIIGVFTVYGSGKLLDGNSTQFSNKLLHVFSGQLGTWTHPFIALAAFGTIYGTFITVWDAFTRCFVGCLKPLVFKSVDNSLQSQEFTVRWYNVMLPVIGVGGFLLFFLFKGGMIKILEAATISVFLSAPVLSFLNLRAMTGKDVPEAHRPSGKLLLLAYAGLAAMILFAGYYLLTTIHVL
jgi:Mn2+/Fe2+ NRAMP family transporter